MSLSNTSSDLSDSDITLITELFIVLEVFRILS